VATLIQLISISWRRFGAFAFTYYRASDGFGHATVIIQHTDTNAKRKQATSKFLLAKLI